jgi:hypothetical protein
VDSEAVSAAEEVEVEGVEEVVAAVAEVALRTLTKNGSL